MAAPGKTTAEGSLGINPILTARFLSLEEKVDLIQSPWGSSAAVLREDLEAGGLLPPAAELDALGFATLSVFFPMVGGGGAQEVWGARTQERTDEQRAKGRRRRSMPSPFLYLGQDFASQPSRETQLMGDVNLAVRVARNLCINPPLRTIS